MGRSFRPVPMPLRVSARDSGDHLGVAAARNGPLRRRRTIATHVVHALRVLCFQLRLLGRGPSAEKREVGNCVYQVFRG